MKNLACSLFLLCAVAQGAAACDLRCSIERQLRDENLTGAVYSILDDGLVRTGAAGHAHFPSRQPMRADSKVHVGSVAKTMLALGVLRLATESRLNLDAPVSELLPQIHIDNPWHARTPVTLRHLLDHTSGLEDLRLWHLFTLQADPRAPLSAAFTGVPDLLRVRTEPGTRFSYSNMGYTLAGMVIEAVTRERYEAWLDRELLLPLGMTDSTFEFVSQAGPHADPRLAWGHYDDSSLAGANPVWVRPAAQFTTTAADMAKVARLLISGGQLAGSAFIEESLLAQMGRGRTPAADAGMDVGYALGLRTFDRHGAVGLCHSGSIVGYRASFCVFREQRKAYFIAHNSDSETAGYARFDELLTRTLGVSGPEMPAIAEHVVPEEWLGRYVISPTRFEGFRYFDLLDSVKVTADARGLELHRLGREPRRLLPVGPHLYRAVDRTRASHALLVDGGETLIFEDTRTLRKVSEFQVILTWLSLVLGLAGLAVLLVLIPWRAWRRREPWLQPASLALVMLLMVPPLFALQPFLALGDKTVANIWLHVTTLSLPLLLLAQMVWAWSKRGGLRSWPIHVLAAALVLQWCVSLYAWDLLPLALWR